MIAFPNNSPTRQIVCAPAPILVNRSLSAEEEENLSTTQQQRLFGA